MSNFKDGQVVRHKATGQKLVHVRTVGSVSGQQCVCDPGNGAEVFYAPAALEAVASESPDILQRLAALEARVAQLEQGQRFA